LVLQERALRLKQDDLRTQEEKHNALRREITRLEGQSATFSLPRTGPIVNVQKLEQENSTKIMEDQKRIAVLEKEMDKDKMLAERASDVLITEKEQEEKKDSQLILKLKQEIQQKSSELKVLEASDSALKQEIINLKKQSQNVGTIKSSKKAIDNTRAIERLKAEIASLNQGLTIEKQKAEKTGRDLDEKKRQSDEHQRILQLKNQEAILAVNRINSLKQEIKMIQDRINNLGR
jgi:hypothetical protein